MHTQNVNKTCKMNSQLKQMRLHHHSISWLRFPITKVLSPWECIFPVFFFAFSVHIHITAYSTSAHKTAISLLVFGDSTYIEQYASEHPHGLWHSHVSFFCNSFICSGLSKFVLNAVSTSLFWITNFYKQHAQMHSLRKKNVNFLMHLNS